MRFIYEGWVFYRAVFNTNIQFAASLLFQHHQGPGTQPKINQKLDMTCRGGDILFPPNLKPITKNKPPMYTKGIVITNKFANN